jgi:hypothetical protein
MSDDLVTMATSKETLHVRGLRVIAAYTDVPLSASSRQLIRRSADRIEALEAENKRLTFVIERDRSQVASGLHGMSKAIAGRAWLSEPGRGSYEWDDERYQQEFGHALNELAAAMEPLRVLARDWSDCPTDPLDIAEARALLPLDKEKVG